MKTTQLILNNKTADIIPWKFFQKIGKIPQKKMLTLTFNISGCKNPKGTFGVLVRMTKARSIQWCRLEVLD
jgi:hypothetical protein